LLDLFYLLFFPPNSLILFAAGFIEAVGLGPVAAHMRPWSIKPCLFIKKIY